MNQVPTAQVTSLPQRARTTAEGLTTTVRECGPLSPQLIVLSNPQSPAAEVVRGVQAQIQERYLSRGVHSFAIISDGPGRGTSFLAANLAASCAQNGLRTVLVDANLRAPRQAAIFGIPPTAPGLGDWILNSDAGQVRGQFGIMRLWNLAIVPAGSKSTSEVLLQHPSFKLIMRELSRLFDIIIYDSPPAAAGLALANGADRTILVGRQGHTSAAGLQELKLRVEQCQGTVAGVVFAQF